MTIVIHHHSSSFIHKHGHSAAPHCGVRTFADIHNLQKQAIASATAEIGGSQGQKLTQFGPGL
jgi:hypothetical protein